MTFDLHINMYLNLKRLL